MEHVRNALICILLASKANDDVCLLTSWTTFGPRIANRLFDLPFAMGANCDGSQHLVLHLPSGNDTADDWWPLATSHRSTSFTENRAHIIFTQATLSSAVCEHTLMAKGSAKEGKL